MGWQKNILRVNLTAGTCTNEPLNMLWAQQYLGSRGLATKYLMEEIDPKVDPLSPDNKLIIATGPLTGTIASTGGRWTAVTKGALTGAIAASNSGGQFGGELKMAGYDLIILEGRAPKPVYLYIEDDRAELLPADELWGKSVWEIEPAIKATHRDPLIRIASIGQAGEYGNRYACIVNDLHRAAGRSGVGAVMGSKQLKAIAVRGTKGVKPHDARKFMAAVRIANEALAENPGRKGMTSDGTISMMDITGTVGALPTRNNRQVQFEGSDKLNAKTMKAPNENGHVNLIQNAACFACTIGCGRISHIDPKHFSVKDKPQYQHASGGLEYETAYALGSAVGVADMEAATYAGFLCNEYGMDPISFGGTLAAAMELFEIGAITEKETGGVKLNFGNAEALCLMAELAGKGEGFGRELGLGSKLLTAKYGHPELSMAVKGLRRPRHAGHGLGLRDQQPRRLPPARQSLRQRFHHPGNQGKARGGAQQPGLDLGYRFVRPVPVHPALRRAARALRAAARWRHRRRLGSRTFQRNRRTHLESRASVQPRRRPDRRRRHPAQAHPRRAGAERRGQGPCQ